MVQASRTTRQKLAVSSLLDSTDEFTSAQDLYALLRGSGERVGLTTVYTQLRALEDAGEIDSVRSDTGETLYRRCASVEHHHHLVCRSCGQAVEVDAPDIESWANAMAAGHGYADARHVVEITGVCRRCQQAGG